MSKSKGESWHWYAQGVSENRHLSGIAWVWGDVVRLYGPYTGGWISSVVEYDMLMKVEKQGSVLLLDEMKI